MIYESALSFEKNASLINEAYEKMYSCSKNRENMRKMITEARNREDVSDDFIFSDEHFDSTRTHRYPDWLRSAAKKAGHTLRDDELIPEKIAGHGAKHVNISDEDNRSVEDEVSTSPEDNLWDNIVKEHPEVFNDENYDMSQLVLPKNKYLFYKKCTEYINKGMEEVEAAKRAFEEIPGCEYRGVDFDIYSTEDDSVGNIDEPEEGDYVPSSNVPDSGYGIVVKYFKKDYVPGSNYGYSIEWITPDELKGKTFDSLEEAKNVLRDAMADLIIDGEPSEVSVGSIVDKSISSKLFNGDNSNLNATIYTISASDKENTDRVMMYENGSNFRKKPTPCDEYLQ